MTSGTDDNSDPIGSPGPKPKRPRRVPYFERPKHPHDWRWVVGGVGRTLITLGLLMFAFVGYQLFATGIETARAQNSLENEFDDLLAATATLAPTTSTLPPVSTTPDPATTSTTSTIPTAASVPPLDGGTAVARIVIPDIGIDWIVVEGVTKDDLKKGPGHFRETPMPGQLGNAAIAGHRTTYGEPFGDLNELQPGDLITTITPPGTFTYSVTGTVIVRPDEYGSVIPTVDPTKATLALVTCHPRWSSTERMVVNAALVVEQSDQVMAPPSNTQPPDPEATLPVDELPTDETGSAGSTPDTISATTLPDEFDDEEMAVELEDDGFSGGWFDDTAAIPHAIGWGLALLAVGVGAYFAGRAAKRLYVCFLVGAVPFVVVLYFFFENVNRLLPPGL